jgi:hypothetical protein
MPVRDLTGGAAEGAGLSIKSDAASNGIEQAFVRGDIKHEISATLLRVHGARARPARPRRMGNGSYLGGIAAPAMPEVDHS